VVRHIHAPSTEAKTLLELGKEAQFSYPDPLPTEWDKSRTANRAKPAQKKEVEPRSSFIVYPNPTAGQVVVSYLGNDAFTGQIVFHDLTGKVVATNVLSSAQNKTQCSLGHLATGMYSYVIYKNGELTSTGKISVMK
jgi:hypothetical protein